MKTFRTLPGLLFLLGLILVSPRTAAQTAVGLYQRIEQSMTNSTSFANPFADTELRLTVTAPAGRTPASSFTWYGFHDGNGSGGQAGNVWKFRLLFDVPGTWSVTAGFYQPGSSVANGPSQVFNYIVSATPAPGQRGHVRVDPLNVRRFIHDDDTHWAPFSVHASMLLDRSTGAAQTWIDQHAALGVNAMAVRFHAEAHTVFSEPAQYHFLRSNGTRATAWPGASGFDYGRFDVISWRHNEQNLDYAHSKNIKLFIWFGLSGRNRQYDSYGPLDQSADGQTLGPLQQRFIRYFLARWGTHPAWWHWTVDSEWEENGTAASNRAFQVAYAKALRDQNPWRTLVSNHSLADWTLGGSADGWSLASFQRYVTDTEAAATSQGTTYIQNNSSQNVAVFNVEGVWDLATATRARVSTLNHYFAGGFSHIAHRNSDNTISSWGANWSTVTNRHKEDATAVGMVANFFNRADLDLNTAVPDHALVTVSTGSRFCLAKPGQLYAIWVTHGGTVSLNLAGTSGQFTVTRYAGSALPATGGGTVLSSVSGGGTVNLGTTPATGFGNDYVFIVRNAQAANITVSSPNGGETWSAGGTANVTWTSSGVSGAVEIELSTDNGSTWLTLSASEPNDGVATVGVPSSATTSARIRVRAAAGGTPSDTSDAAFIIASAVDTTPPTIAIAAPANGTTHGANVTFTGSAADGSGIARVEYRVAGGAWQTAAGTTAWSFTLAGQSSGTRTIDVRAVDASSNANVSALASRSLTFDATPPVLSNIVASASATTATITWTSNEISDSRVQYSLTSGIYDNDTGVVQTGVTSHSVSLAGLAPSQTYYYILITADPYGNASAQTERSFTTAAGSGDGYVTAVESNFVGTSPALTLPWTPTITLASGITYSGWNKGAGIFSVAADNHFQFYQNMPDTEAAATLALAIAENEYLTVSVGAASGTLDLRAADISLTLQRLEFHSPRRFAVLSSVGGFTATAAVFDTNRFTTTTPETFTFRLPDTSAYAAVSGPMEIRIYGYGGQFAGKDTALRAFKLSLFQSTPAQSWTSQDIGTSGGATSYNATNGSFTIQATGSDIFGTSDQFRYVTLNGGAQGDSEIVARVASLTNTNSWAKAGIMMRDGLAANAANIAVLVSPNGNVSFQRRTAAPGATATTTASSLAAPRWLKLVRAGNAFSAYHSANGTTWTQVGSAATVALPDNLQAGLAATSHAGTTPTTAVIDNVTVLP